MQLLHPNISTKLSSVIFGALAALCVGGAIGIIATDKVRDLGNSLYTESHGIANAQRKIAVVLERAISEVHAAPHPWTSSNCRPSRRISRRC